MGNFVFNNNQNDLYHQKEHKKPDIGPLNSFLFFEKYSSYTLSPLASSTKRPGNEVAIKQKFVIIIIAINSGNRNKYDLQNDHATFIACLKIVSI